MMLSTRRCRTISSCSFTEYNESLTSVNIRIILTCSSSSVFSVAPDHEEPSWLPRLLVTESQCWSTASTLTAQRVSRLQVLETEVTHSYQLILPIWSLLTIIIIHSKPGYDNPCSLYIHCSIYKQTYISFSSLSKYPFSDKSASVIMKSFHSGLRVF